MIQILRELCRTWGSTLTRQPEGGMVFARDLPAEIRGLSVAERGVLLTECVLIIYALSDATINKCAPSQIAGAAIRDLWDCGADVMYNRSGEEVVTSLAARAIPVSGEVLQ